MELGLKKNKVLFGFCRNLVYNICNMPATPLAYGNAKHWRAFFFCEVISFGQISQLLRGLKKKDRTAISRSHFEIDHMLMTSWIHTIVYVRNLCAHHSQIWNRVQAIRPMLNNKDRA